MKVSYLDIINKFKEDLNSGIAELFKTFGDHLYQYTMRNWQLDEDEAYEVLYQTLETVGKVVSRYEFSSEKHFSNWLFKIHKNYILQHIRSRNMKKHIVMTYSDWVDEVNEYSDDDNAESFSPDVFKEIIDNLCENGNEGDSLPQNPLFFAMQKALALVTDQERDLLLLRMNNYSYEDIAQMLSIDNNQLKVKFLRAKSKVHKKTLEILNDSSHGK